MVGYDPKDPYSRQHDYGHFLHALGDGVEGLRLGVPRNFFFDDLNPEIHDAVMKVAEVLRELGADLVEVTLPGAERTHEQASMLIYSDVAAFHEKALAETPSKISSPVHDRISRGLKIPAIDYSRALDFRKHWRRTVHDTFNEVDLLLTPTTPVEALPNSDSSDLHTLTARVAQFTYAGTLAGIPSMSIPCGFTASGLPVGALLQARWWNEPLLFRAGVAYQSVTDWHLQRPVVLMKSANQPLGG